MFVIEKFNKNKKNNKKIFRTKKYVIIIKINEKNIIKITKFKKTGLCYSKATLNKNI